MHGKEEKVMPRVNIIHGEALKKEERNDERYEYSTEQLPVYHGRVQRLEEFLASNYKFNDYGYLQSDRNKDRNDENVDGRDQENTISAENNEEKGKIFTDEEFKKLSESNMKLENHIGEEKHRISIVKEEKREQVGNRRKEIGNRPDMKQENHIGEENNQKIQDGKLGNAQEITGEKIHETNEENEGEDEEERRKGLFVTELKPDVGKALDRPKIGEEDKQGENGAWKPPLTFNGSYRVNETLNGLPVVKVRNR